MAELTELLGAVEESTLDVELLLGVIVVLLLVVAVVERQGYVCWVQLRLSWFGCLHHWGGCTLATSFQSRYYYCFLYDRHHLRI